MLVGVIIVVLFGIIGLQRLPYQLSPTVIEPEITVTTSWRGATPYEIERDIIEEQENVLKGIPGLIEMESASRNSRGSVTLRFSIGTEVDDALLRVSNKLNEVKKYPEGADRPVINATGSATSPVIWIVMRALEGNTRAVDTYRTFFENEIRQHLERVEGVADLFVPGGRLEEMHVVVKPQVLASYGLTVKDLMTALRTENANVSAGSMGVGRRDFRIRTTAEFNSPEDIKALVLRSTGQRRVLMGDVAEVKPGFSKRVSVVLHNGKGGMAVGIKPEPGVNILDMTDRVREVVTRLNEGKMKSSGVYFEWVYDQRHYIRGAINLIKKNIMVGGMFAIAVLLMFLRSVRSMGVVATAIPISVIGTFIFMNALGRSLNVVSLSGIAFAVGMLVDNAIVVIENIDRHRKMGKDAFSAAYDGTGEVWGAILASTLTTMAVFLPVVFLKEEAGQLFRDIAIAVVSSVALSLIVSVTVIPMLSRLVFGIKTRRESLRVLDWVAGVGAKVGAFIMKLVGLALSNWRSRLGTVVALTLLAFLTAYVLMPKMEYLPKGNRNFVLTILVPPPGLSLDERVDIGYNIFKQVKPYIRKEHKGLPAIKHMFYVGSERIMLFGALATDWDRASELVPLFRRLIFTIPGMVGVSMQPGIFQTRLARGRTIDVDISGDELNAIVRAAGMMFMKVRGAIPGAQVRPVPSMELLYPEIRIVPDRDRLKAVGMSAEDLGVAIDVMMDGRDVGDFKQEGKKKIDLMLMTSEKDIQTPEELFASLVVTPGGGALPISAMASLQRTYGITQIRHLERNRTITLQVTPPEDLPLQSAMETISGEVIGPLGKAGMLKEVKVRMSGAADKLVQTRKALQWNFVLAALIAYLLMAALFGNFVYPLVIMFTVPLAWAGGFIGLRLLNFFVNQPMDIVTMLGFVILIGVVVNNAILIVHQSLNNVRLHNMAPRDAVMESTRVRLRPIYMSAATSIFGMLPLVVFPGAGSELYRGLGSVILGGLAVSTIFTVFVIPSLLMFVIGMENKRKIKDDSEETI